MAQPKAITVSAETAYYGLSVNMSIVIGLVYNEELDKIHDSNLNLTRSQSVIVLSNVGDEIIFPHQAGIDFYPDYMQQEENDIGNVTYVQNNIPLAAGSSVTLIKEISLEYPDDCNWRGNRTGFVTVDLVGFFNDGGGIETTISNSIRIPLFLIEKDHSIGINVTDDSMDVAYESYLPIVVNENEESGLYLSLYPRPSWVSYQIVCDIEDANSDTNCSSDVLTFQSPATGIIIFNASDTVGSTPGFLKITFLVHLHCF